MSRKQRRDHHPVPGVMRQGITPCTECGERLREVVEVTTNPHASPQFQRGERRYWRHERR